MKEPAIHLLVFLLVFAVLVTAQLAFSFLLPAALFGRNGSPFANPSSEAVFPAVLGGLIVAASRVARGSGPRIVSNALLLLAAFLLVTLSFPILQGKIVSPADSTPVESGSFWNLAGNDKLYWPPDSAKGQFLNNAVLVPANGPIRVVPQAQYDPWNRRFLFPNLETTSESLAENEQPQTLFAEPAALTSFRSDLFAVYSALRDSWAARPLYFYGLAAAFVWLFLGLQVLFAYRNWPLVVWLLVLFAARVALWFAVFCVDAVPAILAPWFPHGTADLRAWLGLGVLGLAGAFLFFATRVVPSYPPKEA